MLQNIRSRLSEKENQLRLSIMNSIIDNKKPFDPNHDYLSLDNHDFRDLAVFKELFAALERESVFSADEDDNVSFIYPVSAVPTHHCVSLADGRSFSAMCAIDAIGATYTFLQDTDVNSVCSVCGTPVTVSMRDGKCVSSSPDDIHAISFLLEEMSNWAGSC